VELPRKKHTTGISHLYTTIYRFYIRLIQQVRTFKTFIHIKVDIAATSAVHTSEAGTAVVMGNDGEELILECGPISLTVARTFSTLNNQK